MPQITESSTLLPVTPDVEALKVSEVTPTSLNAISRKRLAVGAIAAVAAVAGVGAVVYQQRDGSASTTAELAAQRQPNEKGIKFGGFHGKDDDYYFTRSGVQYEIADSKSDDALYEYMTFGCNYNDDDSTYLDHGYCSGDSDVCDSYEAEALLGSRGAEEAIDQCGFACSGENANMTWLVPCMWDTIANMDSYCTTGYNVSQETIERKSRNEGTSGVYFNLNLSKSENVHTTFTGCNLHAFCFMCVYDDGSVNPYCKAYVEHYNSLDVAGWYHFFQQEHNFWCEDEILTDIKNNGTTPCDANSGLCDDDSLLAETMELGEETELQKSLKKIFTPAP